jgi:hypothetical protein
MDIRLRDLMPGPCGWGHIQGRKAGEALLVRVNTRTTPTIIRLSLRDVEQTDISFIRTAVIERAICLRGHLGFCLTDTSDPDLLENWDAAALKYGQPLFAWMPDRSSQLLGEQPPVGLRQALAYVLTVPVARTREVAATLRLSVPNTSNKLKALWESGYILRSEMSAGSRGVEYEYIRIA